MVRVRVTRLTRFQPNVQNARLTEVFLVNPWFSKETEKLGFNQALEVWID